MSYSINDTIHVAIIHVLENGKLINRSLLDCLTFSKGKQFKRNHAIITRHDLIINEVIHYGNGKKGYIAYLPVSKNGMHFIIGHCNYPSYCENSYDEYRWTVYRIKIDHRRNIKPEQLEMMDVNIINKFISEGKYVNAFLKQLIN